MSKIAKELNTVMAGEEPLKNLKVVQSGINKYKVLSARNGGATMWEVNINDPSCSCPDFEYNADEGEICAHIAKVALVADSVWKPDMMGMQASLNVLHEAQQATEKVRELESMLGTIDQANRLGKNQAKDPTTATSQKPENPVETLKEKLEESGVPAGELEFIEKNDAIVFGPDGYLDDSDVYGNFVEFSQSNDLVEYTPDENEHDNLVWKKDVNKLEVPE